MEKRLNSVRGVVAVSLLALGLAGCASSSESPFSRPPSEPPLTGLIDQPTEVSRSSLTGAGNKVLAVALSKNVGYSRTFTDAMRRQYSAWTVQFNLPHLAADVDAVLSDDRLMAALFAPMRSRFKEVRLVRDVPEGFESGADYVGILDLDLNLQALSTFPKQRNLHIANASLLILDPDLVAGPLVKAEVQYEQETMAKGADGNIRDTMYAIKTTREKMLTAFEQDFVAKVSR